MEQSDLTIHDPSGNLTLNIHQDPVLTFCFDSTHSISFKLKDGVLKTELVGDMDLACKDAVKFIAEKLEEQLNKRR